MDAAPIASSPRPDRSCTAALFRIFSPKPNRWLKKRLKKIRRAAGDARDILQIGELREHGVGEAFVGGECGNAIESIIDRRFSGERIAEPVAHQAAAHRRCGGVEDREQAAFACARAQSAFDLERAQGGGVDAEERAAREPGDGSTATVSRLPAPPRRSSQTFRHARPSTSCAARSSP